ncbi:hypothetical protein KAV79_07620 [Candidatus Aerophobetes bacterium]|nr:hypothetical protein [Candidatus Aerophobetes bacterium]
MAKIISKESEMKKELEKEFPKDEMMQQLHLIRWKNYLKTKELPLSKMLEYYNIGKKN